MMASIRLEQSLVKLQRAVSSCLKYQSTVAGAATISQQQQPRVYLMNQNSEPEVSLTEALRALRAYSLCERAETVDVDLKCGSSAKKDKGKLQQPFRGTLVLPHNFGKEMKIIAFVEEEQISSAIEAGALLAGGPELIKRVEQEGLPKCDMCVASPAMAVELKKVAKIIRAKMPSERRGTVADNVVDVVRKLRNSREFKSDRGLVHMAIGKLDFTDASIEDNLNEVIESVLKHRGSTPRVSFIQRIVVSSTYGPSFKVMRNFR